jgi:hypothetical protein
LYGIPLYTAYTSGSTAKADVTHFFFREVQCPIPGFVGMGSTEREQKGMGCVQDLFNEALVPKSTAAKWSGNGLNYLTSINIKRYDLVRRHFELASI